MAVAKQLSTFLDKFKHGEETIIEIAQERPQHPEELELQKAWALTVEQKQAFLSEVERGRPTQPQEIEFQKRVEETRLEVRKFTEYLNQARKMHPSVIELEKSAQLLREQKENLEKEIEKGRPRCPDEVRLQGLQSLTRAQENELTEITKREDTRFTEESEDKLKHLEQLLAQHRHELAKVTDREEKKFVIFCNNHEELKKIKEAALKKDEDLTKLRKRLDESFRLQNDRKLSSFLQLERTHRQHLESVQRREDGKFQAQKKAARAANEKGQSRSQAREKIGSLAKAIRLEWNKPKIETLARKLEEIRSRLDSEVMMSIQDSVKDIKAASNRSERLLDRFFKKRQADHRESLSILKDNHQTVEQLLRNQSDQLLLMDETARERQNAIIEAIGSFAQVIRGRTMFPPLPKIITESDPSLKLAAFYGYDQIEDAVLSALYFRKIDMRESQIHEAYQKTCSWIFQDPEEHQKPWSNFRKWLEADNGCYWIGGKAGCGKSTLMKFLCSDPRTHAALKQWAEQDELIITSYYFWMAGTTLQKGQEGLLRSLLYSILGKQRDLIARVFPKQYDTMMTKYASSTVPLSFPALTVPQAICK